MHKLDSSVYARVDIAVQHDISSSGICGIGGLLDKGAGSSADQNNVSRQIGSASRVRIATVCGVGRIIVYVPQWETDVSPVRRGTVSPSERFGWRVGRRITYGVGRVH